MSVSVNAQSMMVAVVGNDAVSVSAFIQRNERSCQSPCKDSRLTLQLMIEYISKRPPTVLRAQGQESAMKDNQDFLCQCLQKG